MQHLLEKIRSGIYLERPVGRIPVTLIELRNAIQMSREFGSQGRVDVRFIREAGKHAAVQRGGVRMRRIYFNQTQTRCIETEDDGGQQRRRKKHWPHAQDFSRSPA